MQQHAIQGTGPAGHRGRMRGRLLAGPASLADYEILEMLLFLGVQRRDTKPLAKQLVLRFGGLRGALTAPSEALEAEGVPPRAVEAFRMVADAAEQLSKAERRMPATLRDVDAVRTYLRSVPRPGRRGWSVLLLGSRNQVLGDRACDSGEPGALVGQVLREALARYATAAILVRQVAGAPRIAPEDRALAASLRERATALSVQLHDVVVLGENGETSCLSEDR